MGVTDWILLGAILLCAGAVLVHLLKGKKGGCCDDCQGCSGCGKK